MANTRAKARVHIGLVCPAPGADPAGQPVRSDFADGVDFVRSHRRRASLDLIHPRRGERSRYRELLTFGEGYARRLFSIAQGRVIDEDAGLILAHGAPQA